MEDATLGSETDWTALPLAQTVRDRLAAWDLQRPVLLSRGPMGLVLRVERDDRPLVLKCLSAEGRRFEGSAANVLRAFDGGGAVRLHEATADALLMEHCTGPTLAECGGEDAVFVPIMADVILRLRATGARRADGVPTLRRRCRALRRNADRFDGANRALIERAHGRAEVLLEGSDHVLLHGDLHRGNVLRTDREGEPVWLAVDPQGAIGDPAYEPANLFSDPTDLHGIALAEGRADALASQLSTELGLERERLLGWGFVHAAIAASWSVEDGEDPAYRLEIARRVEASLQHSP